MNSQRLLKVLIPLVSLVLFQGCTQYDFSAINKSEKDIMLDEHTGIGNDPLDGGLAGGDKPTQENDDGIGGDPTDPTDPTQPTDEDDDSVPGDTGGTDPNPGKPVVDVDTPTEPSPNPTPPGDKPTDPSNPDKPVVDVDAPTEPSPNPTPPGDKPTDPSNPDKPVVDVDTPSEPNPDPTQPGDNPTDPSNPDNPEVVTDDDKDPDPNPQIPPTKPDGFFDVVRWCRGKNWGATLSQATSVTVVVKDLDKEICKRQGPHLLKQMLDQGSVKLLQCDFSKVPKNRLVVLVFDQNGKPLSDGVDNATVKNAFSRTLVKSDDKRKPFRVDALHLLMHRNVKRNDATKCDAYNGSPLVVDMRSLSELRRKIELTDPVFGIQFDILGANANPAPYTPKLISWFKDPRIMPIVLPKNGNVEGIDQLFGDNTLGPDGEFADHGFAALKKYDKNNDDLITVADPVYKKLKLWFDRNLDGVAVSSELYSLNRAGVEIIDLSFNDKYYRQDKHGNEIKYKSVVKLKNGSMRPMFDIWFAINNLIQNN